METPSNTNTWTTTQGLTLATICFALGILLGYLGRGSAQPQRMSAPAQPPSAATVSTPVAQIDTPQEAEQASAKAAGSVLERLKADPKNFKLLVGAGDMYFHHRAFAQAADFYKRALDVEDNSAVRDQYASVLYYEGDAQGALQQYSQVLGKDPKNDIALFNSGMIRLKAQNDAKGAVEMWQRLLKAYPKHPQRQAVERLIAKASQKAS